MEWEFPEFNKYELSRTWLIVMAIIGAGLIIFSLITSNYLLLLIIAIFVLIYIIRHRREPKIMDCMIFEDGMQLGENTFYEWNDIDKFWIIYEPPEVKSLYLSFKIGLRPEMAISLENQNPVEIRGLLKQFIQEDLEKENESFSDGLSRMMKL